MLKKIKTSRAIGFRLAHDMTKIVPGEYKGARFQTGHIVTEEDIPELLSMGKEHVYILDGEDKNFIHEEEAARRLAKAISGKNTEFTSPREGRINIKATTAGILKVDTALLYEINSIDGISVSTLHTNSQVDAGTPVGGTKIIPLYIEDETLNRVEKLTQSKGYVLNVKPFCLKKVGVIVTGNEVYHGLIQDKFVDVIRSKVEPLGATIFSSTIVPDDEDRIAMAIKEIKEKGCELIVVCGGLSVDPDDVTVEGVKSSGARIIKYGSPVMPGAMVLFAVLDDTPIFGAPAGGLFHTTGTDVFIPRLMAGELINREEIAAYAHGGLCLNCHPCHYPVCPFGK